MIERQRAIRGVAIAWLASVTAVAACACSAPARSAAPSASAAAAARPGFEGAKAECTQRAVDATRDTVQQGVASKAAIGIYVECMQEKGFSVGNGSN